MSPLHDPADVLVVRRQYPVPRERVFAAWLDPASLEKFMCPGAVSGVRVEVEARVGGRYRITMLKPDGDVEHRGEYLVIEPPSRLSFTWISVNTENRPSVVTIELVEVGGGTELILTHRRLPPTQVDGHTQGWTDILGKLAAALSGR
jgi:uncharacterized protein YndB with AHSA1/START domain